MKIISIGPALQVMRLPDGRRKLLTDLLVKTDQKDYTIPKGFVTDYSSIPWFAAWFIDWRKVDIAGVVHDYLYATHILPRPEADRVWRAVSKFGSNRVNSVQSWLGYFALRGFGWLFWNKERT